MTSTYHIGDTRAVLRTLPAGSVDLIVSSPPFLALRSYLPADHPDKHAEIGSESTPGEFLDVLLDVVDECRRVLAPHGSLCFELGDTYAGSSADGGGSLGSEKYPSGRSGMVKVNDRRRGTGWPLAKSLCLIPQSFAFALSYGRNPHTGRTIEPWRVRNIVRWWRPNPPVGALGDKWRPATSEITVACTSARRYWDDIATRTEHKADPATYTGNGYSKGNPEGVPGNESMPGNLAGAPLQDTWKIPTHGFKGAHYATYPPALVEPLVKAMCPRRVCTVCGEPSRRIVDVQYRDASGAAVDAARWAGPGETGRGEHHNQPWATSHPAHVGWTDCGHDSWRRGVVLDPFGGTGTTGQVAEGLGHDSILIDLDARNADLARDRVGMFLKVAT